ATANPTYEEVCHRDTGHAEAVRVVYNPQLLNYKDLVQLFLSLHDPTTLNRQGPDVGSQYRSAIFYKNDQERALAKEVISNQQKTASGKIVTSLEPFNKFFTAEQYHQDYFTKNPGPSCHIK
ncbi:MAG: peptide-methionine (S)-S-oxide reductase MsrA, partial [Candidatus Obscuribacterales bacterium]|nr:peptide-methionine (S)-S-oxide reductase MsrA [Candidatus Obscuribacterales bacterium]